MAKNDPRLVPVEDRTAAVSADKYLAEENVNSAGIYAPANTQSPAGQSSSVAVIALLDSAQNEIRAGKRESAAAILERALRLEPKNALLWNRYASLRLQQGDWEQALTLARKSNSLAAANRVLQAANWRIIARVSEHAGDREGVNHARRMVEKLSK